MRSCEHVFVVHVVTRIDNYPRVCNMNSLNQLKSTVSSFAANRSKTNAGSNAATKDSSYGAMLRIPMSVLACNIADRSDVETVAILGYN
jgi:hypothetical protein